MERLLDFKAFIFISSCITIKNNNYRTLKGLLDSILLSMIRWVFMLVLLIQI